MAPKAAATPGRRKASDTFKEATSFSSFSVNDLKQARDFYAEVLGLDVTEKPEGLELETSDATIFLYPKPNHTPASFTVLNFQVDDIEETIDELKSMGVNLEHYNLPDLKTDERGIFSAPGHRIAWFKDPAGNILSVIENE